MKIDNQKITIMDRHRSLIYIIIIGLWALFQYSNGNKFYGVFIVAFFIVLAISRQEYFALVMASVLVVMAFYIPVIDNTWANLRVSNLNTIQNPKQTLTRIFKPNSGQEVLPPQIQQMLSLLETNQITSYQLSDQLNSDPLINQRITEAAWPIKKEPEAYFLLRYSTERIKQSSCVLVDQRKEIALDYCD